MNPSASFDALAPGGVFHRSVEGFTPRTAQREMARAVEDALAHGGTLVVESGTGTGKTYAYLAPVILSGLRTIISTGTRHLQEQIFRRDLPRVADALGRPVDAVLLKGRANYLCHHRLGLHTLQGELLEDAESDSLAVIERWAANSKTGDIAEVTELGEDSPVWKQVTSTADNCLGGQCPDFKRCFVFKARQQAMKADIVVVNHHLFFSDLTLKTEGAGELLPRHDAVVFDEAHSVAEIASMFFGFSVSGGQITELGEDLLAAEKDEQSGVEFTPGIARVEKSMKRLHRSVREFAGQSVDFDTMQSKAFDDACRGLQRALDKFEKVLDAAAPAGEGLKRCHERCLLIQERLDAWLDGGDHNLIRWAEVGGGWLRFHATPLSVSAHFADMMTNNPAAWIFTSATLAVGDDFSAFCRQLGLSAAQTERWDSPYDFRENALLYLPADMPDPRAEDYEQALTGVITEVLGASRGRAFCLFTSYAMMHRVHRRLCDATDWPVLLQGEAPKNELLKRFGGRDNSVLCGTASFWEGVDVVGERLSCVIIDKLPFAPPNEPVLKNRLGACRREGGNPFMEIQIPSAVISLKQGAGRLIRSETDRGVLVLCDPRVHSSRYGRLFLDSLPDMAVTRELDAVKSFFRDDDRP